MTPATCDPAARYDVVVVGGGHNGLTAAAYLARAGRSVLVLEQLDHLGGAAVSAPVFPGVDARVSRYSYLVSLLPQLVVEELGLPLQLRRRRYSSCTPVTRGRRATSLLVDTADARATADSFRDVTGSDADHAAWQRFGAATAAMAARVFPTMTEPLRSREQLRRLVDDDETWRLVVEEPLGHGVRRRFGDDDVRGMVLTDGLIGTSTDVDSPSLRQNRCFLYHVVGGGTGDWDVPVGGMGAVSGALAHAARDAGAELRTGAQVVAVDPAGEVRWRDSAGREQSVGARQVLAGCAPAVLGRLLSAGGSSLAGADGPAPGAQLKVNMLLSRLPRLRDGVDPAAAFGGTLHVNESEKQLAAAHAEAAAGRIPTTPPCEVYCHSLTDDSVLGPSLRAAGAHTLTLFGLHMPAPLFTADPDAARQQALSATFASLSGVLAEPVEDVLLADPEGRPCVQVRTPLDLERDIGLPGGNIFHRDLSWPFAEHPDEVGRWGVETEHPRVLVCGAGARRGGGVSGIPGRAAAMAVLAR